MGAANQAVRVLSIYDKLVRGETVNKISEATWFGVNEKTIQGIWKRKPILLNVQDVDEVMDPK